MSLTLCMSPPCSRVTACQHHKHKYQGTKRANRKYNQNLKYALTSNAKTTQKTDAQWARQVTETNWTLNHHVIWTPLALLSPYYQPCVRKTSFFASFPPQPVKPALDIFGATIEKKCCSILVRVCGRNFIVWSTLETIYLKALWYCFQLVTFV